LTSGLDPFPSHLSSLIIDLFTVLVLLLSIFKELCGDYSTLEVLLIESANGLTSGLGAL